MKQRILEQRYAVKFYVKLGELASVTSENLKQFYGNSFNSELKFILVVCLQVTNNGFFNTILRSRHKVRSDTLRAFFDQTMLE